MSDSPIYKVKMRRRKELKTDYRKRLAFLKSGKSRLVVRKSNNSFLAEFMEYNTTGDKTVVSFSARALKKLGWKGHCGNIPAAYLTAYACSKKAMKAGLKEAIFDMGLASPVHGGRIFAALKGAIDAGVKIPADAVVFPADERINGSHIKEETAKNFEETKKAIEKEFGA